MSVELLENATAALGDLLDEVVFVGGATITLWITDPAGGSGVGTGFTNSPEYWLPKNPVPTAGVEPRATSIRLGPIAWPGLGPSFSECSWF